MELITVHLNGEPVQVPPRTTLAELLTEREIGADGVATACNGQFVPRSRRSAQVLSAGDQILTFQAITGG